MSPLTAVLLLLAVLVIVLVAVVFVSVLVFGPRAARHDIDAACAEHVERREAGDPAEAAEFGAVS